MTTNFTPQRSDGRSDRQVIFDLVESASPETVFEYDDLIAELEAGVDTEVERPRVYTAVRLANKLLLAERRRYLRVVRGTGYRVIRADEHVDVAMQRKDSATDRLRQGLAVLQQVRMEELDENQRKLHQGQMMVMGALYDAMVYSDRRHARTEAVIESIKRQQEHDVRSLEERLDDMERRLSGGDR